MTAASAITGLSFRAVQAAKNAGCPAIKQNGRVDCDALIAWLAEQPEVLEQAGETVNHDLELALKTRADRLLREHKLAVLRGEYVRAADVEQWGGELGTAIKGVVLKIHLCAPSVIGLAVADAEARLKEIEDQILEQLHLLNEKLEGKEQKPGV